MAELQNMRERDRGAVAAHDLLNMKHHRIQMGICNIISISTLFKKGLKYLTSKKMAEIQNMRGRGQRARAAHHLLNLNMKHHPIH